MSKRRRRTFGAAEKVAILKEHFVDGKAVSEVCEKHRLNVTVFYSWQRLLFENAVNAFNKDTTRDQQRSDAELKALKEKLQKKDSVLAELMEEHITLKKSFGET